MSREAVIRQIETVVGPILSGLGIVLVEVKYTGGHRRALLRIFIDKPGGVTLEDCEKTSRFLGTALDVQDPVPVPYTLEVSSPGLDRPIRRPEDFRLFVGKLIRIKTSQPYDHHRNFVGRLKSSSAKGIEVTTSGEKILTIPFDQIKSARLEVEF